MQDDFWVTGVRHAFVIFAPGTITMCCTSAIYLAPNILFITRLSDIPYHILCLILNHFTKLNQNNKILLRFSFISISWRMRLPFQSPPLTSKMLISSSPWSSPDPLKNSPNSVFSHPSTLSLGYLRPFSSLFSLGCGCGAWNTRLLLWPLLKNPTHIVTIWYRRLCSLSASKWTVCLWISPPTSPTTASIGWNSNTYHPVVVLNTR